MAEAICDKQYDRFPEDPSVFWKVYGLILNPCGMIGILQ